MEMKSDVEETQKQQHFHVLAVDDSLIDRKLLERLLKVSSNYQVTFVESVDKALEYLGLLNNLESDSTISSSSSSFSSSSSPQSSQQEGLKEVNLIMTDYCMPGMSGYDLLKRVKGSSRKDVPVVVMSSENVPSRISMCLEGGAEEFLLKPVQLSDLKKLQPCLLKSVDSNNYKIESSCKIMDKNNNNEEEEEEDQNKDNNNSHKSNNSFSKRKALSTQDPERRPKMKGLPVV